MVWVGYRYLLQVICIFRSEKAYSDVHFVRDGLETNFPYLISHTLLSANSKTKEEKAMSF